MTLFPVMIVVSAFAVMKKNPVKNFINQQTQNTQDTLTTNSIITLPSISISLLSYDTRCKKTKQ